MAGNWLPKRWPLRVLAAVLALGVVLYIVQVTQLFGSIPTRTELREFSAMRSANVLYDIANREVFT
ncbi:MAG: hypothetical protein ABI024_04580, partial [Vicinamibacterales bacterium]